MGFFIREEELERLRQAPKDSRQITFYRALKKRGYKNTQADCLVQPEDTQEWYHLCWERLSDAAFLCRVEQDEKIGKWLHTRVMEIVRMELDTWIGPWYRERGPVPKGALETAHITLAVCEAVDICSFLFSEEEKKEILVALREKGMILCRRYCQAIEEEQNHINNWFMVLLNGFGTAAAVLGEQEEIRQAVHWARLAGSLYNRNDYGETVQYSNYATLHLSHLNEILLRVGVAEEELDLNCYAGLMEWYAASFLYQKPLDKGGKSYPRSVNFGDCAALFRPSGDVLAHISSRRKETMPRQAQLAAWLLETMYPEPELGPDELASFGFFNQFQYYTVLMMPDMAEAVSPGQIGLPATLSFEGGQIISRDCWEQPKVVVAIQAGYHSLNVTSHRHMDQNSFQLAIGKERMLIDPGHCCYRLRTQREAVSELSHNTFSIKYQGKLLMQREVRGNIFKREGIDNRQICNYFWKSVQIVASDATRLYGDPITKAVRVWIMKLPHEMFVVDMVTASEPVVLCTHFCANNRDNGLSVHQKTQDRLVLRRGGQALKLFNAYSGTDGRATETRLTFDWTAMHDYYHPLPNQGGQGKEGSVCRYQWDGPEGKEQIRIHTFLMDDSQAVKGWHVYYTQDSFVRMESPDRNRFLDAKVEMGRVILRDETDEIHVVEA